MEDPRRASRKEMKFALKLRKYLQQLVVFFSEQYGRKAAKYLEGTEDKYVQNIYKEYFLDAVYHDLPYEVLDPDYIDSSKHYHIALQHLSDINNFELRQLARRAPSMLDPLQKKGGF